VEPRANSKKDIGRRAISNNISSTNGIKTWKFDNEKWNEVKRIGMFNKNKQKIRRKNLL
jgi:hypothetical protein